MKLHDLLTSPDIDNLRLAVAMRDMWTEQEWTDAFLDIFNKILLDKDSVENCLWRASFQYSYATDETARDIVYYVFLEEVHVVNVVLNRNKKTCIFSIQPDELLTVKEAISKTVNTWS